MANGVAGNRQVFSWDLDVDEEGWDDEFDEDEGDRWDDGGNVEGGEDDGEGQDLGNHDQEIEG